MDINLTENVKSLDSFFTENNEKYTFDEVPTIDKNKNKLIGNVKKSEIVKRFSIKSMHLMNLTIISP